MSIQFWLSKYVADLIVAVIEIGVAVVIIGLGLAVVWWLGRRR